MIKLICIVRDVNEAHEYPSISITFEVMSGPWKGKTFVRGYRVGNSDYFNFLRAMNPGAIRPTNFKDLIGNCMSMDLEPVSYKQLDNFTVFKEAHSEVSK